MNMVKSDQTSVMSVYVAKNRNARSKEALDQKKKRNVSIEEM